MTIMNIIKHSLLIDGSHLGIIKCAGSNAATFLQGQLTCDVREVSDATLQLGAYCDPKGRMLSLFWIFTQADTFYLMLPKNILTTTLTELKKYGAFSKVNLSDVSESFSLLAIKGDALTTAIQTKHPHVLCLACPTLPTVSFLFASATELKLIWNEHKTTTPIAGEAIWDLLLIQHGIPSIAPETIGKFTPHDANLQHLNGVSFNKGCYRGQEIIARMQYLGKLKTQMYHVTLNSPHTIEAGMAIVDKTQTHVGEVIAAAIVSDTNWELLIHLKKTCYEQGDTYLEANGTPLEFIKM